MTIASGSLALASDILKSLNASGYLDLTNSSVLTISGGVVTQATNFHRIAGEGGADDTLDTITLGSGFGDGTILFLRPSSDSVTITIGHDTGNISCVGNANIVMDDDHDMVLCIYDSNLSKWLALGNQQATRQGGSATVWSTGGTDNYTVNPLIQYGSTTGGFTASQNAVISAITFPVAFSYAPLVFCCALGVGGAEDQIIATAKSVTASGFTPQMYSADDNYNGTVTMFWMAIGPR